MSAHERSGAGRGGPAPDTTIRTERRNAVGPSEAGPAPAGVEGPSQHADTAGPTLAQAMTLEIHAALGARKFRIEWQDNDLWEIQLSGAQPFYVHTADLAPLVPMLQQRLAKSVTADA